ncbi:MAG: helix-turn-helix transcriptional regulator, partial [Treponema sp.]|nr:helix-turn-helix transcriptional regulator [Treponema sp.]
HSLTEREKEIARLIVAGLSNTQIAEQLLVSESSVNFHITNIYRKFDIKGKSSGRATFLAKVLKYTV